MGGGLGRWNRNNNGGLFSILFLRKDLFFDLQIRKRGPLLELFLSALNAQFQNSDCFWIQDGRDDKKSKTKANKTENKKSTIRSTSL